jgi:Uncharacterized conserved protein
LRHWLCLPLTSALAYEKYLITGLLVLVPLVITVWVLKSLIGMMDQSLLLLPEQWHPHTLFGRDIPGLASC